MSRGARSEKELKEKKRLVDDMKHNRKPYEENLRSARTGIIPTAE